MGLRRELAATASAKLCLQGLLQKPGLWKTPHHQRGLCGCQGDNHRSQGPVEIGSWAGQHLAVMDNACLSCQCGRGIPGVLFLWQDFLCDLFFKNGNYSWAAVNFLKPQHCVCISHQEGLQLEFHVPACAFSLSSFNILVKLPSLELSVMH